MLLVENKTRKKVHNCIIHVDVYVEIRKKCMKSLKTRKKKLKTLEKDAFFHQITRIYDDVCVLGVKKGGQKNKKFQFSGKKKFNYN